MNILVEILSASFGYGSGKNFITIVSNVTLSVSTGEFILLVGANGSGKSTIIRGIFDLVSCSEGSTQWHIPKHEIGYIPQEPNIDHDIPATALDVVCRNLQKIGLAHFPAARNEGYFWRVLFLAIQSFLFWMSLPLIRTARPLKKLKQSLLIFVQKIGSAF